MCFEVDVPASTITRILRRNGSSPTLRFADPLTGERLIRASKTASVRYEHDRPGKLVHVDVKKLCLIPDFGGWKAHGRKMGSTQLEEEGQDGFDYVPSTRSMTTPDLTYSEIHDDEKGATCAGFFERAGEFFADHGIVIERVMTDNHWSYRKTKAVADVISDLGAVHKFIRPHCPWQNGKVERFSQTLQTDGPTAPFFETNDARSAVCRTSSTATAIDSEHHALGGHPPISRLTPT